MIHSCNIQMFHSAASTWYVAAEVFVPNDIYYQIVLSYAQRIY